MTQFAAAQTTATDLFHSVSVPHPVESHPINVKGSDPMPARAASQIVEGMHVLKGVDNDPIVAVFGSARFNPGHPAYESARELARTMSDNGWKVLTGAGPGIMEAANRGAYEAHNSGRNSIGVKVDLPREGQVNAWVVDGHARVYDFFVRKILLLKYTDAVVLEQGGYGTFDEAFEELAMIADGRSRQKQVIGVGEAFWAPIKDALREHFRSQGATGGRLDNLDLLQIVTDAGEAADRLLRSGIEVRPRHIDDEMAVRLWDDLERGMAALDPIGPRVAVYGSSKFAPQDGFCKMAGRLGHLLADAGIPVLTCGASALTNAVNAGAKHNGGKSIGVSSAFEPSMNGHVTDRVLTHYGCTAKVLATRGTEASIFFPADYRTFDAAYEILTLHQTGKAPETPTVFVGEPWQVMKDAMRVLRDAGTIEQRDIDRFRIVSTADEAFEIARTAVQEARARKTP